MKNEVLMKKQMRFNHPSNFFLRIFFIMFSQPEVEWTFQPGDHTNKGTSTYDIRFYRVILDLPTNPSPILSDSELPTQNMISDFDQQFSGDFKKGQNFVKRK